MPRTVIFEGQRYKVADGLTDEEVVQYFQSVADQSNGTQSQPQQQQQPQGEEQGSVFSRVLDAGKAGVMQTTQALGALAALGGADTFDFIAEYERDMPPTSRALAEFQKQETYSGGIKQIFNNIETLPSLALQGIGGSYPAMVGGAIGAMAANPITTAAGVGIGSLLAEAGGTFLDVLREEGVNVSDPESLRSAYKNKDLVRRAITKANLRGAPVGLFDAASMGLAGKIVGPAIKAGRGIKTAIIAEGAMQSLGGVGGEIGASIASGDPIKPPAVLAEGLVDVFTGGPETVMGLASRRNQTQLESAGLSETEQAAADVDQILSGREPEQEEPATTPQPTPQPEATTQIGGEFQSERQKEGQEVLTPNAPEQAIQTETPAPDAENLIQPPIERRSNTKESEGFFIWDYPAESQEGRADWAKWQVGRFKGDLREAFRQAAREERNLPESLKPVLFAEIAAQAARRFAKNPNDIVARDVATSAASYKSQIGTTQGQGLQANKQANERMEPYGALLTYLTGTRRKGIQSLPEGVRQTAEGFQQDQQLYNVDSVNEAANTMADEIRNKDC